MWVLLRFTNQKRCCYRGNVSQQRLPTLRKHSQTTYWFLCTGLFCNKLSIWYFKLHVASWNMQEGSYRVKLKKRLLRHWDLPGTTAGSTWGHRIVCPPSSPYILPPAEHAWPFASHTAVRPTTPTDHITRAHSEAYFNTVTNNNEGLFYAYILYTVLTKLTNTGLILKSFF